MNAFYHVRDGGATLCGGGGYIHIFMFYITDFFWMRKNFFCFYGMRTWIYEYTPPPLNIAAHLILHVVEIECSVVIWNY